MNRSHMHIAGLLLLVAATAAPAAVQPDLDHCMTLLDDAERLECFEGIAGGNREAAPAPRGKLKVKESKNPFDDSDTVVLTLTADSGASPDGKPVTLVLRCQSHDTDAYINWFTPLRKKEEDIEVLYRIGTEDAVTEKWQVSTNNTATFYADDDERFIQSLLRSQQLVAQVVPADATPIRAEFSLRGLGDALQPLRQTCGW